MVIASSIRKRDIYALLLHYGKDSECRQLRMEYAGAFYHVTSRGDQRGSIFLTEHDRMGFLETLGRVESGRD